MNKFDSIDPNSLDNDDIRDLGFLLMRCFKIRGWGNPFNYNRFFEFIQSTVLGYLLLPVGGGSDCIRNNVTGELKATEFKGFGTNGKEKSHSFTYNGTSRQPTLEEQEKYCRKKIMRDDFHFWTMIDYDAGRLVKTIQVKPEDVWTVLWPKWKKSWYNKKSSDPRIGGSVSTNELKKLNIPYKIIEH